ncbi:MAG: acyl-CoA thioesterase [Haloarculaceae archaeon]
MSEDARGEFRYVTEVPVRFRDIDPMDHVNNAIYVTYVEQARAEYYEDVIGLTLGEADTVLAHLEVDYADPIELGDVVEVRMRTDELGQSSIPMTYELRVGGAVVATAETVQVTFDRETGEAVPIPDDWRERIAAFEGRA